MASERRRPMGRPKGKGSEYVRNALRERIITTELEPDAILVNCAPPDDTTAGLRELRATGFDVCGLYPHIGRFDPPEWHFTDEYPPNTLLDEARRWKEMGAAVIGGCCGTTPQHIAALAEGL